MWNKTVSQHMSESEADFKNKTLDMEEFWQFLCYWEAIDGCHILMKYPPGGLEPYKEDHNFIIFKSTNLWTRIQEGYIPKMGKTIDDITVPSLIIGGSAFPFCQLLMKPFTNTMLYPQQNYSNYRLSLAGMVTEGLWLVRRTMACIIKKV